MAKTSFTKLGLKAKNLTTPYKVNGDLELEVRSYLPIDEKTRFIQYITDNAIDNQTGCFSPIRIEVYFSIAVCTFYASINFTDKQLENISKTYDLLEENGIIDGITSVVPQDEMNFMRELVDDTIRDIARYNSSAAGIIQMMSTNAGSLDAQITDMLEKIKNKEGLEVLDAIKNVGGTD